MIGSLPPFAIFFAGALVVGVAQGWLRYALLLLLPVVGAVNLFAMGDGNLASLDFFGSELVPVRVDRLSILFGYLFHLAAFISFLFSLHLRDTTQHVAGVLYAGSALGAVFAGDLVTLFVFWELLAVTSVFLIWARRSERATASGLRYLIIQVGSGVLLLAGVLVRFAETGSLAFDYIGLGGAGGLLIFLAFGIKCAFPLLHNWLIDAYPEATPTGTVFLSAFTTKVALYALVRSYPGAEPLIYIGAVMTVFPIFYAVMENDLRRVLAYSMVNQIGFMVTGVGLGTALAINGAVSHAFNDVLFKGLLYMAMGSVLHMTGRIKCTELGGLYKTMPITTVFCIVGAASISAFPLFSGFVSKSMVMAAALEEGHPWVWIALLFASAGVLHHAGIKIPYFAFFAHDSGIRVKDPPLNMLLAMGIGATLCIFIGSYPWLLYSMLPFPVDYVPFDGSHVLAQLQLLLFAILAFAWTTLTRIEAPEVRALHLDADWVYRWWLPRAARWAVGFFAPVDRAIRSVATRRVMRLIEGLSRHHGPQGVLARSWPTGGMVLWVAAMLATYLLFYFA